MTEIEEHDWSVNSESRSMLRRQEISPQKNSDVDKKMFMK